MTINESLVRNVVAQVLAELGRSAADRCRSVFSMDAVGAAWDQLIGEAMTGSR